MEKRKYTLVLIVTLLLIAGFLATSLASYYVSRSSLRDQIILTELPLTSDTIYSEIQRDLLSPVFISSLMANDTFVRDWVTKGEQDETRMIRYLEQIQKQYKTFTSFFVSENTRIYYHSDGILKKVKMNEERDRWYFRVRNMQPDYEINVDPDLANADSMTIFVNYRVNDDQRRFIGVTGVGLTVSAVKDLIETYQNNYNRNIYFVDKNGVIQIQGSGSDKTAARIQEIEGLAPLASDILSEPEKNFRYYKNGGVVHLNTRYIPEFNWYLLVEQGENTITRPILKALMVNLGICALITAVVLTLTFMTISSYQKRLEQMATIDKLTGIYNRQAFDIIIRQALKDIKRQKHEMSVILFDIDHFKKVNDTYGHLAGDAVLQHVIDLSKKFIRDSDILCRWGGEEFLVLLDSCSIDNAYRISETLREAIENTPATYEGKSIRVTISNGVVQYHFPENEDSLLSRADQCLYQAKQNGRNRSEKDIPV
ncbi:MAG: sensor domain-containing diguanylate cyclase [Proteobacteria bacterium]|nr:sensor domain-containing diguanylate cyclase [Pseudomonadota bacterium]MBU1389616.1 sensor domain-containing diguanylate cyclase [Pseudomonadota bacterium]MBU1545092.1 sensor domain-containing diguanylate cyclase [Pseudomonadota bacterium]